MPLCVKDVDDWRAIMTNIHFDGPAARKHLALKLLFFALIALIFAGCSTPITGRLDGSPEVTEVFRKNIILTNHQYYVYGDQRIPFAIIAIDNNYQLRPGRWQEIDMNSTQLSQLTYRMEQVYSINPKGAWIIDNDGSRLGAWYSSQRQTLVKRDNENRVVVLNPEPPDLRGIP
jgi:hypothetical protein